MPALLMCSQGKIKKQNKLDGLRFSFLSIEKFHFSLLRKADFNSASDLQRCVGLIDMYQISWIATLALCQFSD